MSAPHFDAVLFDCDGVLADSETLTNGVLRDMLAERGWRLTVDECMLQFVGKAVSDEAALPDWAWKTQAPTVNKSALAQALRDGVSVPGAALVSSGRTLRIK